jgi:hypothetical protein
MTIGLLPDDLPGALPDAVPGALPDDEPGAAPDAMKPGIHCVRARWIRGFMAFRRVRHVQIVMLMVPVGPVSGFLERADRPRPAIG